MARTLNVETQNVPSLRILTTLRLAGHNYEYGPEDLKHLSNETIQAGAKDVATNGSIAYVAAGYSGVAVLDCSGDSLRLLGRVSTGGNATEIVLRLPYLLVADRPGGVVVIDVSDPERPRVAFNYDSVEFATGIDVSGHVMAVCNRPHGLEIADVSDPSRPRFLGEALVGEAQGVRIRGSFAYAGVWAAARVAVVDISDPSHPQHVADVPLEGFGWGIGLGGPDDTLLAAATGHHNDRGHGHGRGLELMRIGADGIPEKLFRVNTPPYYRRTNDWWRAKFHGNLLVHADGLNGILVYDCSDPENLLPVGRVESYDYAGGAAVAGDRLVVADMRFGVHLAELPLSAASAAERPRASQSAGHTWTASPWQPARASLRREATAARQESHPRLEAEIVYRTGGSVRRVARAGELLVAAAGCSGLEVLEESNGRFRKASSLDAGGPATDVIVEGRRAWVALRNGGIAELELGGARTPRIAGQWSVRPVFMLESLGDWILGVRGEGGFEVFRKDGLVPVRVSVTLPFFPTQFVPWNAGVIGLGEEAALFTVSTDGALTKRPVLVTDGRETKPLRTQGIARSGSRLIAFISARLTLLEAADQAAGELSVVSSVAVEGVKRSILAWDGSVGVICDPHSGGVTAFASAGDALRITGGTMLPGHPGRAIVSGGRAIIPCGHAGIAIAKLGG